MPGLPSDSLDNQPGPSVAHGFPLPRRGCARADRFTRLVLSTQQPLSVCDRIFSISQQPMTPLSPAPCQAGGLEMRSPQGLFIHPERPEPCLFPKQSHLTAGCCPPAEHFLASSQRKWAWALAIGFSCQTPAVRGHPAIGRCCH